MATPPNYRARTGWWVRNGDSIILFNATTATMRDTVKKQPKGLNFAVAFNESETEPGQSETGLTSLNPAKQRYGDLPPTERAAVDQETDRRFRTRTGVARALDPKKDQALVVQWLRIRDELVALKPVLTARCHDRTMRIDQDPRKFMDELLKWIATCVTSRTVDPSTGQPYRREFELINKAFPDIKAIADYARRRPSLGMHTVHAEYEWGLNKGAWFVRAVHFSNSGPVALA